MLLVADGQLALFVVEERADLEFARLTGQADNVVRVLGLEAAEFDLVVGQHVSDIRPVLGDRYLNNLVRLFFVCFVFKLLHDEKNKIDSFYVLYLVLEL